MSAGMDCQPAKRARVEGTDAEEGGAPGNQPGLATREKQIQQQLESVGLLLNAYKVQQYMMLEQLRSKHHEFTQVQGKSAWLEGCVPAVSSNPRKPAPGSSGVRALVIQRRAASATEQQGGQPIEAAGDVKLEPGSRALPAPAPLVLPPSPKLVPKPAAELQQHSRDSQGESGENMSLNHWAGADTPQSTGRQHNVDGDKKRAASNLSHTTHPTSMDVDAAAEAGTGDKQRPASNLSHASFPGHEQNSEQEQEGKGINPSNSDLKAAALLQQLGDDQLGYGSEDDPVAFSDAEEEVLALDCSTSATSSQHDQWKQRLQQCSGDIRQLESTASGLLEQDLDGEGALACLSGRTGRYLLKRVVVSVGRSTDTKGDVDVDLAKEGPAHKVSRRQAYISLKQDGEFYLCNTGRRALTVNGVAMQQFQTVQLPHLSMLDVGGLILLFLVNRSAVERVLRRTAKLSW